LVLGGPDWQDVVRSPDPIEVCDGITLPSAGHLAA
jgi:hypothetical protein